MFFTKIHHIAIICANYEVSKRFYTELLGFSIINEYFRKERESYKLDLKMGDIQIELFSFPSPPPRQSHPEATGLRHLAFLVKDIDEVVQKLKTKGVVTETVRVDEFTNKRFAFFMDPDGLPIEIYEE